MTPFPKSKLPRYRAMVTIEVECPVLDCDWATVVRGTASQFPSPRVDFERHWFEAHKGDMALPRATNPEVEADLLDLLEGLAPRATPGETARVQEGVLVRVEFPLPASLSVQVRRAEGGRIFWGSEHLEWSTTAWTR